MADTFVRIRGQHMPQKHIQEALWKYCLYICIFTPRQDIEMKQSTKCSSHYVLCFYSSYFHVVPLSFDTTPPGLNKFLNPSVSNISGSCQNHFAIAAWASSHAKWLRLRCFSKAPNNHKSDGAKSGFHWQCWTTSNPMVSTTAEVAALVWGLALSCWKRIVFSPTNAIDAFFHPF
jgi:hypothetical protein